MGGDTTADRTDERGNKYKGEDERDSMCDTDQPPPSSGSRTQWPRHAQAGLSSEEGDTAEIDLAQDRLCPILATNHSVLNLSGIHLAFVL